MTAPTAVAAESTRSLPGAPADTGSGRDEHRSQPRGASDFEVATARTDPRRMFGHFVLLDEVGKGGMGVVYRAWNDRLRRTVALKMLLPGSESDSLLVQRFQREAQAVARLKHPNIVSVHEVGELLGRHFLAMDFIEGATLDRRLARRGQEGERKLSLTRSLEALRDVARAVHHAHEQGVIHRDLKPSNIMLDARDHAWVMDFGLAHVRDADMKLTKTGIGMGTPAFMSPEQADGSSSRVDARSDVYSLGATLYYVLTGRAPFEGTNNFNLLAAVLAQEPTPPGAINRRASGDLETICLRCLEKDPERRYQTSLELALDLDRHLSGDPIAARPVGRLQTLFRRVRRHKVRSLIILALAVSAIDWTYVVVTRSADAARHEAEREKEKRESLEHENRMVQQERDAAQKRVARALCIRSQRAASDGRWREAASFAAKALSIDDKVREYRVAYAVAKDGPWRKPVVLSGHDSNVNSLACSKDGEIVSGSDDRTVRIWRREASVPPRAIAGHEGCVLAVALSPDEKTLASGGADGTVRLWEFPGGAPLATLRTHKGEVNAVAWSPDGRFFASGGSDFTIQLHDALGRPIKTFTDTEKVLGLAMSPNGAWIAAGTNDPAVRLWEVATGRCNQLQGHSAYVWSVAWSRDGLTVASGSRDRTIRLWETQTGRPIATLRGHGDVVASLAFSPDGRRLASASWDHTVRLWDARTGVALGSLGSPAHDARSVAWSEDGTTLAVGTNDVIELHDMTTRAVLTRPDTEGHKWQLVQASPSGRRLMGSSDDQAPKVFSVENGAEIGSLDGPLGPMTACAFAADGYRLALSSYHYPRVYLWNVQARQPRVLEGHQKGVRAVAFSPDAAKLATWSLDGSARIWDGTSGRELLVLRSETDPQDDVLAIAWSGDSKRLATTGKDVRIWDAATGRLLRALKGVVATSIAWSPDGRSFLLSSGNSVARVYDIETSRETHVLKGHPLDVSSVAWSSNGLLLATGCGDGTVRLWDAGSPSESLVLPGSDGRVDGLAFSLEGDRLAARSDSRSIRIWPLDEILGNRSAKEVLLETEKATGLKVDDLTLELVPLDAK
ncbi:serine/threonine protein kinase [bacterium]|nr:serine/threonine protein kinase [bacterium]